MHLPMHLPRIHILGGGQLGAFLAFQLRSLRAPTPPVVFLLRPDKLKTFTGEISLTAPTFQGTRTIQNFTAESSIPGPRADYPIETLIVATKAHQVQSALGPLLPRISPSASILLLHSGVPQNIPNVNACFAGMPNYTVRATSPFNLALSNLRGKLVFARIDGKARGIASEGSVEAHLVDSLRRLGSKYLPHSMLRRKQLLQLACEACINPLSALYNVRIGSLLGMPHAMATMDSVFEEVFCVMERLRGTENLSRETMGAEVRRVAEESAAEYSTMALDLKAGKWTEVESITGMIVRMAKELGLPCPVNESILARVTQMEEEKNVKGSVYKK